MGSLTLIVETCKSATFPLCRKNSAFASIVLVSLLNTASESTSLQQRKGSSVNTEGQ